MPANNDKLIGIDLGTTNSVLGVIQAGAPVLLNIQGERLLPSVVGISPQGELLVGTPARNQWVVAPDRTVRSIKRKMGKDETVEMAGKHYTPQEISAFILREIKQAAEAALGGSPSGAIQRAVITVPAYFNEVQRQATMEAGAIAGLQVERIINEPTAAALAYGYGVDPDEHLRVLVYDLGGGTFDVSIIEMNLGVVDVLATAGDNFLGGDDFDERLAALIADEFQAEHDLDLRQHHQAWARLLREAEEAKIRLSGEPFTTMTLEYIAQDKQGNPLHIHREVSRAEFVEAIQDLLDRTMTSIDQALKDARLTAGDVNRVLLVGGSTRIPAVWELVAERMEQDPHIEIDPDAAVALGAAVQAGIIAGEEIDAILVDVTPMSLGIETAHISMSGRLDIDHFVPLIHRNATIPVEKSEIFSTLYPGQESIHIKVYQGESPVASQNVLLGDFMVEEVEANRPDGLADVTVNFKLDINGILDVTVTERGSGKQVTERLHAERQRLSPEQIAESQAKLDTYSADDVIEGEVAVADLEFDEATIALLDRARNILETPGLDPDLSEQIMEAIDDLYTAAQAADDDQMQEASDHLIDLLFEAEE
ncbi:MAG: Hsp70 family protein [Caldilineaceae bacterium]